jgi:hypothetical protein
VASGPGLSAVSEKIALLGNTVNRGISSLAEVQALKQPLLFLEDYFFFSQFW